MVTITQTKTKAEKQSKTQMRKDVMPSLIKKSDTITLLGIAWNWFLVFASIAAAQYTQSWIIYFLTVWLIGSRMVALAEVFGHDSVHYNLFNRKDFNRQLDFLWFLPVFENWKSYQEEHDRHHRSLLTPEDPAWQDYKRWGFYKEKKNTFWIWFIRPFLLFDTIYMLKTIVQGIKEDCIYRQKILIFWSIVLVVCFIFGVLDLLLLYWIVPLFWVYPALIFWSETGEHYGVPGDDTRNTFGFLEWLMISTHNDRYHYVHHCYPRIPWFQMKKAHYLLLDEEKVPASRGFLDLYRQFRKEASQPV